MNFRASLICWNSRRDSAGNCYYAFTWTDLDTKKVVNATFAGNESNLGAMLYDMNGGSHEPHDVIRNQTQLPIRQFNRMTKDWPYAGCPHYELAEFINRQLYPKSRKIDEREWVEKLRRDSVPEFQAQLERIAKENGITLGFCYVLWRRYSDACQSSDQSAVLPEFEHNVIKNQLKP